jgi:F-type H+-transporting ATPase subunit a
MLKKTLKITAITLGIIGVIIVGNIVLKVDQVAIEVAPEPIFNLGPFVITNAFFTSLILSIIIVGLAFYVGRNLKENPGGLQNIVEFVIETLDGFVTSLAPKKWASTFFPILATIFIYLLFANWFSLLTPLLGSFGFVHPAEKGGIPLANVSFISGSRETFAHAANESATAAANQKVMLVPIFRAPSSDLNLTVGLALMTMILVEIFGLREHGLGYLSHLFVLKALPKKAFGWP